MADSNNKYLPLMENVDFFLKLFQEKIPHAGEDSLVLEATPGDCVCAVFDGCGGTGSRKYPAYAGKTGAYMASRAAAGALHYWFTKEFSPETDAASQAMELKSCFQRAIDICQSHEGSTLKLKGRLIKDFPTTAAILTGTFDSRGLAARCFWAGDSRCYVLNKRGLRQLTLDDLAHPDAMENLTADGALTNVISGSSDFVIHSKAFCFTEPCILLSATDGCFAYFSTPMEFEYLLLKTMQNAASPEQWEENMQSILKETAGDDFSMSGFAAGYGSFQKMKSCLLSRLQKLEKTYIQDLHLKSQQEKRTLWEQYRPDYMDLL